MIPITDVALLLRGWRDSKRLLRVTATLGGVVLAAFCRVYEVAEDGFTLTIGSDGRDMIGFVFEGWEFDFDVLSPEADRFLPVGGGTIESAIVGLKQGSSLTIMLFEE